MKTLIKKLNQVNKNVYSFFFILGLLLTFSSNLKAEFDTISVKDDYRIIDHHYKVMNDSVIITYIYMLDSPDSLWNQDSEIRLVNYNVNSMTYTHTYEIIDSNHYYPHDFVLSNDKSKILMYPSFNKFKDSLYIFNTIDGTIDSILTFTDIKINYEVKQLSDGRAGVFAESASITTEWDKSQKYIGQIDLNNYSSTFFAVNPDFEMYDEEIINFNIRKSYHDGYDKEVILYTHWGSYIIQSMPFDSNLVKRDLTHISFSLDSGIFWWNTGIESEDLILNPIYFQNDRYFTQDTLFYDAKEEIDKDLYIKVHKSDYSTLMGFSNDERYLFYNSLLGEDLDSLSSFIIIYDFENDVNIDSLQFFLKKHPIFNYRDFKNIKFLNDSVAIGLIRGGIIKFKFVLETSTVDEQNNQENYKVFPNPAGNQLNIVSNENINNIKIIDLLGREIYNSNSISKQIDVSFLETGIYYIVINNKHTLKFIKD